MGRGIAEIEKYQNNLNLNRERMSSLEETHYKEGKIEEIGLDMIENAPEEWNKFDPLSEEKMNELIGSIRSVGLLHPIIVWDNGEGKREGIKTCLSGHNRLAAYKKLMEEDFDKYSSILAIVKGKDDIDENLAQQIIIDTNITQRELSGIEKSRAIVKKFRLLKERKDSGSEKSFTKALEREFGITGRQIRKYKQLTKLITEFQNMIDTGDITIDTGSRITRLLEPLQSDLLEIVLRDESKLKALNKKSKELKANFTKVDIEKLFEKEEIKKGIINIEYLDKANEVVSAKLIYPKEEENSFIEILENIISETSNKKIKYNILK